MNPDRPYTRTTYKQALKQANQLFNSACRVKDETMMKKWQAERNRLLDILGNWTDYKEGAD